MDSRPAPAIFRGRAWWSQTRWANLLCVGALLLVAGYVRLPHGDLSWFVHDQARDAYTATAIASGRSFPLLGPEVRGGPAHTWGPLYFYVLAVPFALSRDPATAVFFLSAISVVAVLMTYGFGRAFFGERVGLFAAALFATYPLMVNDARALSNVALLPPFVLVFFYALFSLIVRRRSWMIIPLLTSLAALTQLHLSTLPLVVLLVISLALFRPQVRPTHLVIALAGVLLLSLPYTVAQARSGFQDISALFGQAAGQVRPRQPSDLWKLAGRVLFASPETVGSLRGLDYGWRLGLFKQLHRLEAYLLVLGVVSLAAVLLLRWTRPRASWPATASYVLLALWLVVPFLMIGQNTSDDLYYFNVLYPAPFLTAADRLRARGALSRHLQISSG